MYIIALYANKFVVDKKNKKIKIKKVDGLASIPSMLEKPVMPAPPLPSHLVMH